MHSLASNDLFRSYDNMFDKCVGSTLITAALASKYAEDNGFLVTTGAAKIFDEPQPDMLTYSLAKSSVHSLNTHLTNDAVF